MNDFSTEEIDILTRCLELENQLEEREPPAWHWERNDWEQQVACGPRYLCSRWFGPLSERVRVRYRRAIDRLEERGLIETHREWGTKLSNLQLTALGTETAEELQAKIDEGADDGDSEQSTK